MSDVREYSNCDTLITEPTVIESPLYPQYYGQLAKCVWTIRFPPGKYPHLQIKHLTLPAPDELADIQAVRFIFSHFFSSTGQRQASLCHGPLSVVRASMRPSVHALTFSLNIFFSETSYRILMKFHRHVPAMVLFRIS